MTQQAFEKATQINKEIDEITNDRNMLLQSDCIYVLNEKRYMIISLTEDEKRFVRGITESMYDRIRELKESFEKL